MKYAPSVCSLAFAVGLCLPVPGLAETFTPRRAADLQESIGVVVHFNYTDGAYARPDEAMKNLAYLGVTHLRDRTPEMDPKAPQPRHPYIDIMKRGYSFNFLARGGDFNPVDTIAPLTQLARAAPGRIDAIEGFNEVDHDGVSYHGVKGAEGAAAAQSALYAAIRADPVLGHLAVYDLTGVPWPQPDEKRADFLNSHLYAQNGNPPGFWFDEAADKAFKRGMPLVVTEFGYASMPESGWLVIGVDKRTQAKGILLGLFQAFSRNIERTYIYELLDEKPDPLMNQREFHFGLFDFDYHPKPSAKAIHNLTAILHDTSEANRTFKPFSLDINVDHFPKTVRSMVIAKADGTFYLALWNDASFWDRATGKAIKTKPVSVTLLLPGSLKAQALYDPLEAAKAIRTYNGETTVTLDVPDHPIMLEVRP